MRVKCPHCSIGCNKCHEGYSEIQVAEGEWVYRVCLNRAECGFVNGGSVIEAGIPLESSGACVTCGGPTEWLEEEDVPSTSACHQPENAAKWQAKRDKEHIVQLRLTIEKLKAMAIDKLISESTVLTLDDCRLLGICRICHKQSSGRFTMNYGAEFAHTDCLTPTTQRAEAGASK